MRLYAAAGFLGDLSRFDGGEIGFDAMLISGTWNANQAWGEIVIRSPSLAASADIAPGSPSSEAWQSYSGSFTAEAFGVDSSTWADLIAEVTELKIVADDGGGTGEVVADDNVRLLPSAPTISITLQSDGTVRIDFTGTLQESDDLDTWMDVMPQPTSPLIRTPSSTRNFFRAVE